MDEVRLQKIAFDSWWAREHPWDWWAAERGAPLPSADRLLVWDLCKRAYEAGATLAGGAREGR